MKIIVATQFEAGSMFAHAINTVNMAHAFAGLGHSVTILCFRAGKQYSAGDLQQLYGLKHSLNWVQLFPKLRKKYVDPARLSAFLSLPTLLRLRPDFVYSRTYLFSGISSKCGVPSVAETHAHVDDRNPALMKMIEQCRDQNEFRLIITISDVLKRYYESIGAPGEKVIVLPTGMDLLRFTRFAPLPLSPFSGPGPHVTYAGHLYDYKGIPTILNAAKALPEVTFHLVGGTPKDLKRHGRTVEAHNLKNVILHGLKPYHEVPPYLWHADLLLLPPSLHHASAAWTSPVKLGEYLASETPIIATDIPALRAWVTDEHVIFIPPDDPAAMTSAIREGLDHPERFRERVKAGRRLAECFSYRARASTILERCGFDPEAGSGGAVRP